MPKSALVPKPAVTDRKAAGGRLLKRQAGRLPDIEQAAAAFMAADLPWLAPEAREALAAAPEVHGRPDDEGVSPSPKRVLR